MKNIDSNPHKISIDPRALYLAVLKVKAEIPEQFGKGNLTFREYMVARNVCDKCVSGIRQAIDKASEEEM